MFHPEGPTLLELFRQALSSTERGYDLLAPKFDRTPFRTPESLIEAAAPLLGEAGSISSALDLCCGTGAALGTLQSLCRDRVVGLDFSLGMLGEAGRLVQKARGTPVELVRADALSPCFEEAFDLVTCFGALGHFRRPEQPALLQSVQAMLKPGGRFVFVTADHPPIWRPALWIAHLFNAAMTVRNVVWRPPFVMLYLTFLLPRARALLEEHGFAVETFRGFAPAYPRVVLVVGKRS